MIDLDQEKDPEVLRQVAKLALADNGRLVQRIVQLTTALAEAKGKRQAELALEIQQLKEQLAQSQQRLFGKKSERRSRGRRAADPEPEPDRGHGPREQPELPHEDTKHTLPEDERTCPSCGGELQEWPDQEETAEEVDVIERKFVVRIHRRQKYHCACGACVKTAPGPTKLIPGGRYSLAFAIAVALDKYDAVLPLERQVRQMRQLGLVADSQTLWDQVWALVKLMRPLHEWLGEFVRSSPVVFADETPWRMLDPKVQGKWYVWGVARPEAAYYTLQSTRGNRAGEAVLGEYRGTIVCDGYAVYEALAKRAGSQTRLASEVDRGPPPDSSVTLAGCWSHVRRKFVEAEPHAAVSREVIDLIGELFAVERQVPFRREPDRTAALTQLGLRAELREQVSRPIVERIFAWAKEQQAKTLPRSALGKALTYLIGHRKTLVVFLGDARVPVDNNAAERSLRGVVLGRKNFYGSKGEHGAEAAAVLYTIIESCKLAGVPPKAYVDYAARALLAGDRPALPHEWVPPAVAADEPVG